MSDGRSSQVGGKPGEGWDSPRWRDETRDQGDAEQSSRFRDDGPPAQRGAIDREGSVGDPKRGENRDAKGQLREMARAALDDAERALAGIGDNDFRRAMLEAQIADLHELFGTSDDVVPEPPESSPSGGGT